MSRAADLYARVSTHLAHRPGSAIATRLHARLVRRTRGRLGGRALGADVLVLCTTGRRSGKHRDAPLFFVTYGPGFAVLAANAASARPPAWWLNLQQDPDAEALVRGHKYSVRARAASGQETSELWPRLAENYSGIEHYKSIARRELPVVVLEPR
jgi:deazaflavin-dependent oxidoreductase (nitroreductase family)